MILISVAGSSLEELDINPWAHCSSKPGPFVWKVPTLSTRLGGNETSRGILLYVKCLKFNSQGIYDLGNAEKQTREQSPSIT